jgi:hypothetical protein
LKSLKKDQPASLGWSFKIIVFHFYLAPVNGSEKQETENTDNAITYFARYTNRTAISDSRIETYNNENIRFRYKNVSV